MLSNPLTFVFWVSVHSVQVDVGDTRALLKADRRDMQSPVGL